jgi:hypothetical protein
LAGLASECMQGISAELPSRSRIAAAGDSDLIRICKDFGKFEPSDWSALTSAMFRAEGGGQQKGRDGERKTKARQVRKCLVTGGLISNEDLDVHVGEDVEMEFAVCEIFNVDKVK